MPTALKVVNYVSTMTDNHE